MRIEAHLEVKKHLEKNKHIYTYESAHSVISSKQNVLLVGNVCFVKIRPRKSMMDVHVKNLTFIVIFRVRCASCDVTWSY